jgi:hypothetical protein
MAPGVSPSKWPVRSASALSLGFSAQDGRLLLRNGMQVIYLGDSVEPGRIEYPSKSKHRKPPAAWHGRLFLGSMFFL